MNPNRGSLISVELTYLCQSLDGIYYLCVAVLLFDTLSNALQSIQPLFSKVGRVFIFLELFWFFLLDSRKSLFFMMN